jgi:hypothetical protein
LLLRSVGAAASEGRIVTLGLLNIAARDELFGVNNKPPGARAGPGR